MPANRTFSNKIRGYRHRNSKFAPQIWRRWRRESWYNRPTRGPLCQRCEMRISRLSVGSRVSLRGYSSVLGRLRSTFLRGSCKEREEYCRSCFVSFSLRMCRMSRTFDCMEVLQLLLPLRDPVHVRNPVANIEDRQPTGSPRFFWTQLTAEFFSRKFAV